MHHEARIIHKFIWLPKCLYTSNDFLTNTKFRFKWLCWAYIEKRWTYHDPWSGEYEFWTDAETYLKHFNISTNTSTKEWDWPRLGPSGNVRNPGIPLKIA